MNPDAFNHLNMSYTIVPTIRKNPFAIKSDYKFTQYVEEGRPVLPEVSEPEIVDCSDALSVIASIKAKL